MKRPGGAWRVVSRATRASRRPPHAVATYPLAQSNFTSCLLPACVDARLERVVHPIWTSAPPENTDFENRSLNIDASAPSGAVGPTGAPTAPLRPKSNLSTRWSPFESRNALEFPRKLVWLVFSRHMLDIE